MLICPCPMIYVMALTLGPKFEISSLTLHLDWSQREDVVE
jgi:hypothetical protein